MPDAGVGAAGGFAWSYSGAACDFVIYVPRCDTSAARTRGDFSKDGGSIGSRNRAAGARRIADNPLGLERPGDPAVVGVGGARVASNGLSLHAAYQLAAAPER